ncbi:hypothetical protein D922_01046 [Enterococcus faecalis 06-MB-DW-09]|nr:hypothetical protein D922_01046 [Enterococcus faecalis 06-MB-DW-09]
MFFYGKKPIDDGVTYAIAANWFYRKNAKPFPSPMHVCRIFSKRKVNDYD